MFIIVNHSSSGGCKVMPVIFSKVEEGKKYLESLLEKEIKKGFARSWMNKRRDTLVVFKEGADCWEREYILQKLAFPRTIYAEAQPLSNYCGRIA